MFSQRWNRFRSESIRRKKNVICSFYVYKLITLLQRSFERFVYITDLYQEQAHLLDGKLNEMLDILLNYVKKHWSDQPPPVLLFQSFKYLCHLTKIRGHKVGLKKDKRMSKTFTTQYLTESPTA